MSTYIVRVSPNRVVLRTQTRNTASALFRSLVKEARRGEGLLPTSTITLEEDGRVLAHHDPVRVKPPGVLRCAA